MIERKRVRESEDLGRFVQSDIGGELVLGGGLPDFTLSINQNTYLRGLIGRIQKFYQSRGHEPSHSNRLHFTKGHQRRTVYLTTECPKAYATICNPDA
ncbi:hypothetical protein J4429_06010 [Candidatus Pacearchaeota archaeon]|nr:hypothetical protein [Candidatus Pacearchaeota archaeon]